MPDVTYPKTDLLDAINICLSCIGETPVSALSTTATNVVLANKTIREVSRDVQSKGWWFNQGTNPNSGITIHENTNSLDLLTALSSNIPEEARRYITIRAARVFQSRYLGSEELHKFSYEEEQVSLAILTQAHVRNGGKGTSFNSFPTELKGMGVEEVMFLQQSAEEKLLSLRLVTELKSKDKIVSEKELVDAQTTNVGTDSAMKAQQTLKEYQGTKQLELQNIDKDFYDAITATTPSQLTYRDFAAEMRMMGIQEAQFQSNPAYKKVELIKDAEKLRKQHTESNRYRMNTRITNPNGGLRADNNLIQFYGLATTHPAYQNPVTTTNKYTWHGFNDTTGGSTGSPTTSGKHLANGNPKGFNLSTNFTNGLNEDGTAFVNDTTGNAGITFAGDTFASRSFMENYAVHVRRPNDIEVAAGKTFSVTFFVNFHQPNNDATGSYLLEAIADNALTVYVDDVQVGVKEYQPSRWEDENTLAYDKFNWDRPQDILLTNITSGFHKVTLEFSNVTDNPQNLNTRTPDYVAGHTDDKLVGVASNPVAVAARLSPLKSADITDDYDQSNTTSTVHGQHGNSLFIWDTTKQYGLGTYDESDIEVVNDVLRLIGEPPAKEFHENALAIEAFNLIRKTDIELQGRGWFFNTEKDILLGTDIGVVNPNDNLNTSDSKYKKSFIQVDDTDFNKGGISDYVLSFEANDYKTQLRRLVSDHSYRVLYNTKTREIYDWFPSDGVKGTAIVHKELSTCPQKYKEYLTVRVATILTELYPQSGIDIQRLPKMEQELETYFKDIQADEANYSVFDNYDTASRIGINRNYDIS